MTEHRGTAHYREVGQLCLAHPTVVSADVVTDPIHRPGPVLEVTVQADRIPPGVLRTLAEGDLGVVDVTPQGPDHRIATTQ